MTSLITDLDDVVTVLASSKAGPVPILLDRVDAERLPGRGMALGSHGYAQIWFDGQNTPLHRWILGAKRGDGRIVDHIDRDRLNNRRSNLRFVTPQENSANRRCSAASGHRGVYARHGRWYAQGKVDGHNYHLGVYDTAEDAAHAADQWRRANLPGYLSHFTATAKPVAA